MNPVVVYQTKTGSSQQYATWLAEEIGCPLIDREDLTYGDLNDSQFIIYVASIYAAKVIGLNKFLKQVDDLDGKKLVLCMVGMTDLQEKSEYDKFFKENVPEDLQRKVQSFNLRGNVVYSKLGWVEKLMLNLVKVVGRLGREDNAAFNYYFKEHFGEDVYFADRNLLKAVVDYYRDYDMRFRGI